MLDVYSDPNLLMDLKIMSDDEIAWVNRYHEKSGRK